MRRLILMCACLGLLVVVAVPARSDVVGEGVGAVRCTEGADIRLPKKMALIQTIGNELYSAYGRIVLFVDSEFAEPPGAAGGKLVITVFHLEQNGARTKIGRFRARFDGDGRAEGDKGLASTLREGDRLEWKVKLVRMPMLEAAVENCWNMTLAVVVGEDLEGLS